VPVPSQEYLDLAYTALAFVGNTSIVAYAPFARSWKRSLVVPSVLALAWTITRFPADMYYDQDAGPGIPYVIVPLEAVMFASIARALKVFLFRIFRARATPLEKPGSPPLGDTTQFHSLFLRHLYVCELAVGEVGGGVALATIPRVVIPTHIISCILPETKI
jgi:hypothetical protein